MSMARQRPTGRRLEAASYFSGFESSTLATAKSAERVSLKFHRYAVLVAISSLILIAIGALITSQASGRQPESRGILDAVVHRDVAIALGILVVALALWQPIEQKGSLLVWTAVGFLALEGLVGWLGGALLHATLAPVAFAILVAIAVVTSAGWNEKPELVEDQSAAALRIFALVTPPLILLQIMLGAAYRHKAINVLPHLGGAMIVSLAIVVLAVLILQRHPGHRRLCAAATWLISILAVQVVLGFTALVIPVLKLSATAVIAATALHVVVGSLTLAANLVLVMQVLRSVRWAPAKAM